MQDVHNGFGSKSRERRVGIAGTVGGVWELGEDGGGFGQAAQQEAFLQGLMDKFLCTT